jgi:hypothetical protein
MRDLTPDESAAFATRSKGHFDELDHGSPVERLSQEPDRSGLQGARPIAPVLKGRNKNGWRAAIQSLETVLQLDAVRSGHLNVTDQT